MADTTTGLHVKSLAGEFVRSKIVDTGGTNEASVSAAGRVSVDASGIAVPVTDNAGSLTVDAPVGTPAYVRLSDGAANLIGQKVMATSLPVTIASDQSALAVTGTFAGNVVDNAGFTDGTTTVFVQGYIFDDVAGTALTENDAAAARIDSKRAVVFVGEDATTRAQKWAISAAGALSSNITQVGGATHSATVPLFARMTDGTAVYSKTGQTAGTASFAQLSDQTTAVNVIAGTNALKTDLSSVAGTATVTGGVAGTQGVGGVLAHDAAAAAALPVGIGYFASAAAPTDVSADGDATKAWSLRNGSVVVNIASGGTLVTLGQKVMASSLPVTIASDQSALAVTGTFAGNVVDNAAFTDGTTTVFVQGYIFDETPGTALTENDAAAARIDSKRAVVFVGEDATTRSQRWAISAAGALAGNLTQVGGSTISATVPVSSRLTDGTAYYSNTGQTAGTSVFSRINDGTTTAGVIVGTTALKTDASSIAGAVPSATNPLPVRLTDGAAFYAAASGAPTLPVFSTKTSSALGAGASVDLTHYVTSGKTGQLMGVDVASTVPMKVVINTEVTAAKTARVVLFTLAAQPIIWRAPYKSFITRASADATSGFSVSITNKDATVAADVYSTAFWDEV